MYADRLDCPHAGCDAVNPPPARFCGRCGRRLGVCDDAVELYPAESVPGPQALGWMTFSAIAIVALLSTIALNNYEPAGFWFFPLAVFGVFWFRRRGARARRRQW